MPRTDKKAYMIAWKILGKPANMQKSRLKTRDKQVSSAGYYDELVRIQPEVINRRGAKR